MKYTDETLAALADVIRAHELCVYRGSGNTPEGVARRLLDGLPESPELEEARKEIERLKGELAMFREIAKGWAEAADKAQQPDVFYAEYSEKSMRAMQALLTKAREELAALREVPEDVVEKAEKSLECMIGPYLPKQLCVGYRDAARSFLTAIGYPPLVAQLKEAQERVKELESSRNEGLDQALIVHEATEKLRNRITHLESPEYKAKIVREAVEGADYERISVNTMGKWSAGTVRDILHCFAFFFAASVTPKPTPRKVRVWECLIDGTFVAYPADITVPNKQHWKLFAEVEEKP